MDFGAFEEEGEEELVEALGDVDGDIVDAILHGTLAEGVEEGGHLLAVGVGNLIGLEADLAAVFEVDEEGGSCIEVEVDFVGEVVGVEEDDLVLVVAEVAEGVEEGFLRSRGAVGGGGRGEGVGEDDDEGAAVELLGEEVDGLSDVGGKGFRDRGTGLEEFVEFGEEVLLVEA